MRFFISQCAGTFKIYEIFQVVTSNIREFASASLPIIYSNRCTRRPDVSLLMAIPVWIALSVGIKFPCSQGKECQR
jgi:hypothetical protein